MSVLSKHGKRHSRQGPAGPDLGQLLTVNYLLPIDLCHSEWINSTQINDWFREKSFYDGSNAMNGKTAAVLLSGLLVACAQAQPPAATAPPAPAQAGAPAEASVPAPAAPAESPPGDHLVYIRRASCQDLLNLTPEDRAAASMFYIGYQAARLRARSINVGVIPSIQAQAFAYCQEDPDRPVAQAFAEAYSLARR